MTLPVRILLVAHALGGGVEGHVGDLRALLAGSFEVDVLRPAGAGAVQMHFSDDSHVNWRCDNWPLLVQALQSRGYSRVLFHHIHGFQPDILALDQALNLPFDVTLHDYFAYCPQYQLSSSDGGGYCGEPPLDGCRACLQARPHVWGWTIERWHESMGAFLARASRVIAPTAYVKAQMAKHFPAQAVLHQAHPPRNEWVSDPAPVVKVVVLGALSRIKGLETLIQCAEHASNARMPLSFVLLGFPEHAIDRRLPVQMRGEYSDADLPALLALERADVVWFPGKFPETHAYTLDVALDSGLPIVASERGAFTERLATHPKASLLDADASPAAWNQALVQSVGWGDVGAAASGLSEPSAKAQAVFQQRTALRQRYLAFLTAPLQGVTRAPESEFDSHSLQITLPPAEHMPLTALFEHGVVCGKHEPRDVLGQRLKDIERDYAVLAGYSARADKPWFVLLEETEAISSNAEYLRGKAEDLRLEAERVRAGLQEHIRQLEQGLHAHADALAGKEHEVLALKGQLSEITHRLAQTDLLFVERGNALIASGKDLVRAVEQIRKLETSTSWKVTSPLRAVGSVAKAMRRRGSRAKNFVTLGYRRLPLMWDILKSQGPAALGKRIYARVHGQAFTPPPPPPVQVSDIHPLTLATLGPQQTPKVSLVIPVYGQHQHTFNCLKSLGEHTDLSQVEVIVVDDASPEPASKALGVVQGIRLVRNTQNLGFIGSCHAGADLARGEYLVLLNNDVQVTDGWLDALLAVFALRADAGMVGARLVYPDGRLQEAGGIVWRDASAWNWGRNQDPERPEYRYLRAADYCSGACLALRRSDWVQWGGFDRAYMPAYYEDTDLAFRVRKEGKKLYYQPEAKIIHFEGISSGTDVTQGVKRHQVINQKTFFDRWQDVLLTHRVNGDNPLHEVDRSARAHVLIVEACMITPDQDSGSVRMLAMLELLVEMGCKVSFIADNLECRQPYARTLQQAGVEVWHYPYVKSVSQLLQERGAHFDMIMFCRHYIASQYVADVRKWAPHANIVFDTVDLHYLREQRKAELEQSDSLLATAAQTRQQELGVIKQVDVTLVVSPIEQALLADDAPGAAVKILSNIHEPRQSETAYAAREGLLFIGGFRHPPNVDAVEWFVGKVWPLVKQQLPSVTLTIVGSHMPDAIKNLAGNGIHTPGFVEDVHPLIDGARISLAPLRYGAGVKGKINQAMACGLPVVATSVAAEGMSLIANEELLVADEPQDFADAVVRLYQDPALWAQISANGYENVRKHFSRATAKAALAGLLNFQKKL